ncbi:hypothetical protein IE81DRAFT_324494 [Ceraceosorus guamensis]|uniref:Uncharacterized protein n=1 Tax=Ceraceosorus guamensis TaxID=1522189 RepID=A0A316VW37_9BASI|nr:hypothetical protein IE81DRAFT_324494 [Ceraceosorus guamensis]PWN41504.1 hypothetical protein IE81DRAFT_324494 [Ceraceosorus guamensis]
MSRDRRPGEPSFAAPLTPPRGAGTLPTPPTSHIELSGDRPPHGSAAHFASGSNNDAPLSSDTEQATDGEPDASPSAIVMSRRQNRLSQRGSAANFELQQIVSPLHASRSSPATRTSLDRPLSDQEVTMSRSASVRKARRVGRNEGRRAKSEFDVASDSDHSSFSHPANEDLRSRTPSPILGSSRGHLSAQGAFGPSAENVDAVLFGENDEEGSRQEVESLLDELRQMSLATGGIGRESNIVSIGSQLGEKALRLHDTLHHVRLRAIAALTSQRTKAHASLVAMQLSSARQAAELDDARTQARMLGSKLARAEARVEESIEEELRWTHSMRHHGSALAQQQAARQAARTNGAQADVSPNAPGLAAPIDLESIKQSPKSPAAALASATAPQAASSSSTTLSGLGISAGGAPADSAAATPAMSSTTDAEVDSPLTVLTRNCNKLSSDKRYLKAKWREEIARNERLEQELRAFRPLFLQSNRASVGTASPLPASSHTPRRSNSSRRRGTGMGDAEAELLLATARRMRETRRTETRRSPQKAGAIREQTTLEDGRPTTPPRTSQPSQPSTPFTPRTPRTVPVLRTPGRDEAGSSNWGQNSSRQDSAAASNASPIKNAANVPGSASSARGIDELLHAAQTVMTPSERPAAHQTPRRGLASLSASYGDRGYFLDAKSPKMNVSALLSENDAINESPKRRRMSTSTHDASDVRFAGGQGIEIAELASSPEGRPAHSAHRSQHVKLAEPQHEASTAQSSGLSALDLLADQAAASQQPSQSSDHSRSGGLSDAPASSSDEGMIEEEGVEHGDERWFSQSHHGAFYGGPPASQPSARYAYGPEGGRPGWPASPENIRMANVHGSAHHGLPYVPRAVSPTRASPSKATLVALQASPPKSKGGNTSPDKRLPYIRWSEEEDRRLKRAISEYGQRWEQVARSVGTRSYHQCRQRALLMRRKTAQAGGSDGGPSLAPASSIASAGHPSP